MARKTKVSLYLGVDSLGGVVTEGGKVIAACRFDLSVLEEEARVEDLSEEIKWEALINRTLREIGAETKDVYLSLADRDFIFRFLEMPLMRKKEIQSSLTYEVEKYIPFKLDELLWDYGYASFSREKKMDISFVGIKEDTHKNMQDLFSRLDLNVVACEPASVSLARVVKSLKQFSKLNHFAILDFTDSEGYLTFFYHNLPVFNRYFVIPRGTGGIDIDEFVKPIRLSFQYFSREFKSFSVDKLIVVADKRDDPLISMLREDLQLEVDMVCPEDLDARTTAVENLKAYGASDSVKSSYKFKPDLRRTYEQVVRVKKEIPLNLSLLGMLLVAAVAVYAAVFIKSQINVDKKKALVYSRKQAIVMPEGFDSSSWRELETAATTNYQRARTLEELRTSRASFVPFLERMIKRQIDSVVPDGIWFDAMDLDARDKVLNGRISCAAFMDDEFKEREIIDEFLYAMKRDATINKIFPTVEMVSLERKKREDFIITEFSLRLY